MLALALPLFNDEAEEEIGQKLKAENTKLGQKIFSRLRTRTNSLIDERINNLRPTLGILRSGPAVNNIRPRSQTYDMYPSMIKNSRKSSTTSFCNDPEHKGFFFSFYDFILEIFFFEIYLADVLYFRPTAASVRRVQSDRMPPSPPPISSTENSKENPRRLRAISEIV